MVRTRTTTTTTTTTKRSDARRHRHRRRRRRREQLKAQQGPMFPSNQLAQSARDDSLDRVMIIIDSHE